MGGDGWRRYGLPNQQELIFQHRKSTAPEEEILILILLSTTVPSAGQPSSNPIMENYYIECELVNLEQPLDNNWSWAFGDDWAWKPKREAQRKLLLKRGHGR